MLYAFDGTGNKTTPAPTFSMHASVGFRSDIQHGNNPPANCPVVDDAGLETGPFVHV